MTIAAAHDVDLVNGSAIFVHTAASDDPKYNGKVTDVTATEVEDDKASLVFSSTAVTVPEGGSATYTVKLSNQPSAGVTIWAFKTTGCDTDLTHTPAPRSFSTSNWNVAQTWTLSAAEDGDDLAGTCTINHDADGAEYDALSVDLIATEGDNDRRGFVVTPSGPVNMDEGGTHTYSIKLGTEPTADVVVALSVEGDSDITVAPRVPLPSRRATTPRRRRSPSPPPRRTTPTTRTTRRPSATASPPPTPSTPSSSSMRCTSPRRTTTRP